MPDDGLSDWAPPGWARASLSVARLTASRLMESETVLKCKSETDNDVSRFKLMRIGGNYTSVL